MKKTYYYYLALLLFFFIAACDPTTREATEDRAIETEEKEIKQGPISLVIHGGAGTIKRENMTEEQDAEYRAKLSEALEAGYAKLESGAPAMDAVIAAIQIMEESPLFNAGVGAVFTNEGKNELDAAVMDGKTRDAGAVAGVSTIKSPILAALSVMDDSPHVMMSGTGAEQFAGEQGLELVDPEYFFTQSRYDALQRVKKREEEKTGVLP